MMMTIIARPNVVTGEISLEMEEENKEEGEGE